MTHHDPEFRGRAFHLGSLANALLAGVAINHIHIIMQQLSGLCQVMHVGSRGINDRALPHRHSLLIEV